MQHRIVKLVYPDKSQDMIRISISKIPFIGKTMTMYDTVDFFEKKIFPKIETVSKCISNKIRLKEIINLHNNSGIKDHNQIVSMVQQIKHGEEVLSESGLPNIRLVKTEMEETILFDGHHSLLAYIIAGKKYLNEIPHLMITNENGYVSDKEINVFFGKHSSKIKDWRDHAINWQAPEEKQLCKRIQKNMGELLDSLHLFS